jgi:hypothetical protein
MKIGCGVNMTSMKLVLNQHVCATPDVDDLLERCAYAGIILMRYPCPTMGM